MSHDLRNAIGYRHIPTSDPKEQELRDALFAARTAWVGAGAPCHGDESRKMAAADARLSAYLWDRARRVVDEDRARRPRAKRNAAVGSDRSRAIETPHIDGLTNPDPRGR